MHASNDPPFDEHLPEQASDTFAIHPMECLRDRRHSEKSHVGREFFTLAEHPFDVRDSGPHRLAFAFSQHLLVGVHTHGLLEVRSQKQGE